MHTDQIRYLAAIDEKHSLRKASQELHISPQALKLSLDALEREFGTTLFDRSRGGTYLNEKGRELLDLGAAFLKGIDALKVNYVNEGYQYLPRMKAVVYTTPGLANTLVAKAISELTVKFPQSEIDLETMPSSALISTVKAQKNVKSLAIASVYRYNETVLPDLSQHYGLEFKPIVKSAYYCSIPRDLNISRYNSISMSTILKHPILIYGPTEAIAMPLIKLFGEPERVRLVKDFAVYYDLLQNDRESLAFSQFFGSHETLVPHENRRLVPINENIEVQIGLLLNSKKEAPAEMGDLAQFMSEYIRKRYV